MAEQLPLDFEVSATVRHRRAVKAAAADDQPTLFAAWSPNLDIHLHSPGEAMAQIGGSEPERAHHWLAGLVGSIRVLKTRRVAFPADKLDQLLYVRPPAQITLDAAATAVGRALWAARLGLKPLRIRRDRQRLFADSPRWPTGLRVKDAPWTTIASLTELGLPYDVDAAARTLLARKLADAGTKVATAGLAGSAVFIKASRPDLVEGLGMPALAYAGEKNTGRYKLPLLAAEPLLNQQLIEVPADLKAAIRRATGPIKPLKPEDLGPDFPWTLFDFQAKDAGRAVRILETTGGVLLAGDMGSGKTTIGLALAQYLELWPLLVVSPLSAFSTWERQLGEMGKKFYLATESPAKSWEQISEGAHDAVVISFDRLPAFVELIDRMPFRAIIADEIQRIRTPGAKRSRALRALASSVPMRIGLSGTPLTNGVADVLPLASFLAPGEWRPRANEKDLADMYPGDPTESLAEHLGCLMVRRRIDQVGKKMPKRNDHRIHVETTPEQRAALAALEAEAQAAKDAGEFDGPNGKFNALVKLSKMRGILANPAAAGLGGPNPKVEAAVRLAKDFHAQGRKGVLFTVDRASFRDLGQRLDAEGIRWGGIWGATPPMERIEVEKRLHRGEIDVVICTIAAGAESWTASPTATYVAFLSYVWAPSSLSQAEARVYRLNADVNGPPIEVVYLHAHMPGGSLDDRMVEVLEGKKALFAQVVDRAVHQDTTQVHLGLSDLLYVLTGTKDDKLAKREKDTTATSAREQAKKKHAVDTLYAKKGRNKTRADVGRDDGSTTVTLEEYRGAHGEEDLGALLANVDLDEDGDLNFTGDASFDAEPDEE